MLCTTHTLGSNSTVSSGTPGQSVVALITFATIYCGILVLCAILLAISWCWCWCSDSKDMKESNVRNNIDEEDEEDCNIFSAVEKGINNVE